MEETRMQIAAEEKEVSKPAPYQLLGLFWMPSGRSAGWSARSSASTGWWPWPA